MGGIFRVGVDACFCVPLSCSPSWPLFLSPPSLDLVPGSLGWLILTSDPFLGGPKAAEKMERERQEAAEAARLKRLHSLIEEEKERKEKKKSKRFAK